MEWWEKGSSESVQMSPGIWRPGIRNYTKPSGPAKSGARAGSKLLSWEGETGFLWCFFFFQSKDEGWWQGHSCLGSNKEKEKALIKDVLHGKGREE